MKVVIDEGVPRHLASALIERGFDASRFPRKWISLSNGVVTEIDGTRTLRRIVDGAAVEERLPALAAFRF